MVSKSVFEFELVLGMWRFLNIIVDILQEVPQFLASLLKSGTDSIVNSVEKIKH